MHSLTNLGKLCLMFRWLAVLLGYFIPGLEMFCKLLKILLENLTLFTSYLSG